MPPFHPQPNGASRSDGQATLRLLVWDGSRPSQRRPLHRHSEGSAPAYPETLKVRCDFALPASPIDHRAHHVASNTSLRNTGDMLPLLVRMLKSVLTASSGGSSSWPDLQSRWVGSPYSVRSSSWPGAAMTFDQRMFDPPGALLRPSTIHLIGWQDELEARRANRHDEDHVGHWAFSAAPLEERAASIAAVEFISMGGLLISTASCRATTHSPDRAAV